jgi:hypothetical protein
MDTSKTQDNVDFRQKYTKEDFKNFRTLPDYFLNKKNNNKFLEKNRESSEVKQQ